MLGVALMWTWAGYCLAFYGFSQIRGGNDGFAMLAFPWVKWSPQPSDSGSGTTTSASSGVGPNVGLAPSPQTPAEAASGYLTPNQYSQVINNPANQA